MTGYEGNAENGHLTELVARAAADDAAAWHELSRRYDREIRRVARSFRLSGPDADDVCQETWLTAYRRLVTLRCPASLPCWLRSIARNECLARLRSTRAVPVEAIEVDDDEIDVAGDVLAAEQAGVLHEALAGFTERDRLLVVLLMERRPYEEISHLLTMPIGSIGPTRCRIFEKLRKVRAVSELAA